MKRSNSVASWKRWSAHNFATKSMLSIRCARLKVFPELASPRMKCRLEVTLLRHPRYLCHCKNADLTDVWRIEISIFFPDKCPCDQFISLCTGSAQLSARKYLLVFRIWKPVAVGNPFSRRSFEAEQNWPLLKPFTLTSWRSINTAGCLLELIL